MNRRIAQGERNVVSFVKGGESYFVIFDDANRVEAHRKIGDWAADSSLSLSWYDAAILSQRIRKLTN